MAASLYAADPPETMLMVEVEGLTLLYHRKSGLTHFLAPPAPQILGTLASGPASAAQIADRMGRSFEIESDDPAAAIAARLAELEAAGLVWRTASSALSRFPRERRGPPRSGGR